MMGVTEASENCLEIGTRLSDFEITGVLGEGGFGIVYLAFDHALQRIVAIKEYMPGVLAARGHDHSISVRSERHVDTFNVGLKSFINEARFLAQFDHPSLVKVYRYWEQNRTAYTAMKYYEGRTIKDIVAHSPELVTESWCRSVLGQILDALELLDTMNIVHRDVSPDNIIMQGDGAAVLLDFGSARQVIGDAARGLTVILKPGYAPVEQYAGEASLDQGPYTDIYALSAVMYFAIVGEPPATSIARMVKDPVVPLRERGPAGFSAGFLSAIDHGLAVLADDRPQSIDAFRALLGIEAPAAPRAKLAGTAQRFATVERIEGGALAAVGEVAAPVPVPTPRRRRWPVPAAAGLALAGVIGMAYALLGDSEQVMRPMAQAPRVIPAAAPALMAPPGPVVTEPLPEATIEPAVDDPAPAADIVDVPEVLPATVSYQLAIRPAGTVYVDGKKLGLSQQLKKLELTVGKHTVKVVHPGFANYVTTVHVKADQPGTISHHFAASSLF